MIKVFHARWDKSRRFWVRCPACDALVQVFRVKNKLKYRIGVHYNAYLHKCRYSHRRIDNELWKTVKTCRGTAQECIAENGD